MKQPIPTPVGIWLRVSTNDQFERDSPEQHHARACAYAEAKGWKVIEVYDLGVYSGRDIARHPETERMMHDIERGRIEALIFSKLARLARNVKQLLELSEYFERHHAHLISLGELIDTSTAAGRLFFTVVAAVSQFELEETSERIRASIKTRAKLGKPLGGAAPFGYRWQDGQLVPDPVEGPIRKRMYELFLEHGRVLTVARLLNESGLRTRRGHAFTHATVRRILADPLSKGKRRTHYASSQGDGKSWIEKPPEEWIWHDVEPVVSNELWDECNALLQARRPKRKPGRKAVHLFSGVVYCHCGAKMYVKSSNPNKYACTVSGCRHKIPKDDLEQVFHEQLHRFVFDPQEIAAHSASADSELSDLEALLSSLLSETKKVRTERDKLYLLYQDDHISGESFGERDRPLEIRLGELSDESSRVRGQIDALSFQRSSRDRLVAESQSLYTRWPDLPFEEKRQVVEAIVESISIGKEEISIQLSYLDEISETAAKSEHALAPARGARAATAPRWWPVGSFNPRPCARGEITLSVAAEAVAGFQSAPLREGRGCVSSAEGLGL